MPVDPIGTRNVAAQNVGRDFLLAEHAKYHDAFIKNEELGERRMQFFLGLVTAGAGAVVLLATSQRSLVADYPSVILWISGALALLILAVGLLTYDRLLKRDQTTAEYMGVLDEIRRRFVQAAASPTGLVSLEGYDPFPKHRPRMLDQIGRLAQLTLAINAWLAGAATVLWRGSIAGWPDTRGEAVVAGVLGVAAAAAVSIAQLAWWRGFYRAPK
jgi:hypothetical protein